MRSPLLLHRRAIFLLILVALLLGAATSPAAAADPGVAQAATADRAAITQQAEAFEEAYRLLMDEFVHPLDSATLLQAAWEEVVAEGAQHGAPPPEVAPTWSGDRAAALASFRVALLGYQASHPDLAPDFVPAHAAVRGLASAAHERHTQFLDPEQYQAYLEWSEGAVQYAGIGVALQGHDAPTVTEVYERSPAERAGLRPGDVVEQVDGSPAAGETIAEIIDRIRGPEGSTVELLVRRPDEPAGLTIRLERARVLVDFVAARLLADGTGYIRLRGFADATVGDAFEQAVATLEAQGARRLVLDLRGNPGGSVALGSRLLGHFLPRNAAMYEEIDRSGRAITRTAPGGEPYPAPGAILVDEATASMAEIFAATLQAYGATTVVGWPTAGSVARAQVYPLGDGSALQLTDMEILGPTGEPLNGVGVAPDLAVEANLARFPAAQDPALALALAGGSLAAAAAAP